MAHRGLKALCVAGMLLTIAATPMKSPAWLSIEAPASPYDAATRGAAFLVHADIRGESPPMSEVSASLEGMVNGGRQTKPLRLEATSKSGVFAVRRQWPATGSWLAKISLMSTTAIVTFDAHGDVEAARVPTYAAQGTLLPRPISAREIDSTLTELAKR